MLFGTCRYLSRRVTSSAPTGGLQASCERCPLPRTSRTPRARQPPEHRPNGPLASPCRAGSRPARRRDAPGPPTRSSCAQGRPERPRRPSAHLRSKRLGTAAHPPRTRRASRSDPSRASWSHPNALGSPTSALVRPRLKLRVLLV